MRLFEQVSALRAYLRGVRTEGDGKEIGFVPTMGALHEGHASLIRKAKSDCDVVVVSVFVNPTQFGLGEDLAAYPRSISSDQQLCSNENTDALFIPSIEEMYPAGFQTVVEVTEIASTLEGAHRPGHFAGVATVVLKLLNIVQPDRIYMGQKDYQQGLVIERMTHDLNLQTEVVSVPTVRAADGVALSSRNTYLSPEERRAATVLYKSMQTARDAVATGEADAHALLREMQAVIAAEPLARADYVCLVDPATLKPVTGISNAATLAVLAVRIGKTRLIDNMLIAPPGVSAVRPRLAHYER